MLEKYEQSEYDIDELYEIAMPKISFLRDCSRFFSHKTFLMNSINEVINKYEELDYRFII
jgi:hypothetical protein